MPQVALLTRENPLCWTVANALAAAFPDLVTIIEEGNGRLAMLARRRRRFGIGTVVGQAAFAPLGWVLRHASRHRLERIVRSHYLDSRAGRVAATRVASINSEAAIDLLRGIAPDVVAVAGTRLIGAEVLTRICAPFINIHAGITPAFRGNDAGYWALAGLRRHRPLGRQRAGYRPDHLSKAACAGQ
jgi:hypothetical protein